MALPKAFRRAKIVPIGKGISGTVERHETGSKKFVVKTYHCKENYETRNEYKKRVLHEYDILKRLRHRNFIAVIKYEVSLGGGTIKMYMEAGAQDLFILFKNATVAEINLQERLCMWKQACTGVRYLHTLGICHRDLKLENMVWDPHNRAVKIIDLATAAACDKAATGKVGSSRYMAPETYAQINYEGAPADVWSLGICFFYMAARHFPWKDALHADAAFVSFLSSSPSSALQSLETIADSVDLLKKVLCVDPRKRVSMDEVFADLWFDEIASCDGNVSCGSAHAPVEV